MERIDIPLYAIRHAQIGGTEFAIYNLVRGLSAAGFETLLHIGRERDLSAEFLSWSRTAHGVTLVVEGGLPGPKAVRFAEEFWFQQRRNPKVWALFPNYFCPSSFRSTDDATAVILHDIQYKCYPQYHSWKRKAWLDYHLPMMFRRAKMVGLISRSELSLVREHFGQDAAEKCEVIYNAIDWTRFELEDDDVGTLESGERTQPYILSVCHQFPHKNVRTLLQAFSAIAQQDRDIELYLVGSATGDNRDFIERALPEGVGRRVHLTGFVSDARLGRLYREAQVFVLPSLYEGFGMPAVEALGLGVPTIVSNSYALPEVTLGYAEYIDDPLNVDAWVGAIGQVLTKRETVSPKRIEAIRQTYDPRKIAANLVAKLGKRD